MLVNLNKDARKREKKESQMTRKVDNKSNAYMSLKEQHKETDGDPKIQVPPQTTVHGGDPSCTKDQPTENRVESKKLDLHSEGFQMKGKLKQWM